MENKPSGSSSKQVYESEEAQSVNDALEVPKKVKFSSNSKCFEKDDLNLHFELFEETVVDEIKNFKQTILRVQSTGAPQKMSKEKPEKSELLVKMLNATLSIAGHVSRRNHRSE